MANLCVSLHAPVFSELPLSSLTKKMDLWNEDAPATPPAGRKMLCPFLWLFPKDVLVEVCRFGGGGLRARLGFSVRGLRRRARGAVAVRARNEGDAP
mmetsp:Transcript_14345/g.44411  ORF Transcript_14345/g.44411 Transcript_14345/m.44411 type:complete len:97 (-) Transcript_14345:369-659(-)